MAKTSPYPPAAFCPAGKCGKCGSTTASWVAFGKRNECSECEDDGHVGDRILAYLAASA